MTACANHNSSGILYLFIKEIKISGFTGTPHFPYFSKTFFTLEIDSEVISMFLLFSSSLILTATTAFICFFSILVETISSFLSIGCVATSDVIIGIQF
jgi:hypothetical protein